MFRDDIVVGQPTVCRHAPANAGAPYS